MAEFKKIVITTKGQALMAKMIAGRGAIDFTKVTASDTAYTDAQLEGLIALTGIKQTTLVSKVIRTNNVAIQIEAAMTNTTLTAGYYMKTIGLYAVDPDDGEILYGVSNATVPGWMPPYNGITVSGAFFKLITTVGNAENVSLNVDPGAVATIGDIHELQKQIADLQSYIGYTDTDIYGVEVDFKNKKFTRLAGAVNKVPGVAFDNILAFGGRKRCNLADNGTVNAYYGDTGYSETGSNGQVMVEQPKFYYKLVPLALEKNDAPEIDTYTITAGASASGNISITLNGTLQNVAVLSGDTATQVATKIRNTTFAGWTIGGSETSVTFEAIKNGVKTAPSFTDTGTTGVTASVKRTQCGYIGKGFKMRKCRYYISMTQKADFKLHPAFIKDNIEKEKIYLSAFEGSLYDVSGSTYILNDEQIADFTVSTGDKLSSIANTKPISGLTQDLTRRKCGILAENRGTGWSQQYAATKACSQLLFAVEYASFNTQEKLGIGATNKPGGTGNESELTGATTNLGNGSGSVTNVNGFNVVTYRGEENIWGNIWMFTDGMNIHCDIANSINDLYIADNGFAENTQSSPYVNAGVTLATKEGYVSAFAYSESFDWLFVPAETAGDSALPVGDYHYHSVASNGYKIAVLGGSWVGGVMAGGFAWNVADVSGNRYRHLGGRLVYVPA